MTVDDVAADAADVPVEGAGLIQASFAATGVLAALAVGGVVAPDSLGTVTAVGSGLLFVVGSAMFLWGYATGVVRSRDEQITLGGMFFLVDSAPSVVRFRLRVTCAAQTVVACAAAAIRPYTAVAFVVLAPMLGLGAMALWGARHGTFAEKESRR